MNPEKRLLTSFFSEVINKKNILKILGKKLSNYQHFKIIDENSILPLEEKRTGIDHKN